MGMYPSMNLKELLASGQGEIPLDPGLSAPPVEAPAFGMPAAAGMEGSAEPASPAPTRSMLRSLLGGLFNIASTVGRKVDQGVQELDRRGVWGAIGGGPTGYERDLQRQKQEMDEARQKLYDAQATRQQALAESVPAQIANTQAKTENELKKQANALELLSKQFEGKGQLSEAEHGFRLQLEAKVGALKKEIEELRQTGESARLDKSLASRKELATEANAARLKGIAMQQLGATSRTRLTLSMWGESGTAIESMGELLQSGQIDMLAVPREMRPAVISHMSEGGKLVIPKDMRKKLLQFNAAQSALHEMRTRFGEYQEALQGGNYWRAALLGNQFKAATQKNAVVIGRAMGEVGVFTNQDRDVYANITTPGIILSTMTPDIQDKYLNDVQTLFNEVNEREFSGQFQKYSNQISKQPTKTSPTAAPAAKQVERYDANGNLVTP